MVPATSFVTYGIYCRAHKSHGHTWKHALPTKSGKAGLQAVAILLFSFLLIYLLALLHSSK